MNDERIQVLLVEDNPAYARLLAEAFGGTESEAFRLTHLTRLDAGLDHLSKNPVDVVLLDLGLPDADGLRAVQGVRSVAPSVPIVVLSGRRDPELALEALRQGAQDYLVKGSAENEVMLRAVRYAMERHRLVAETELVRKRQLQVRDEFFSHVSHELRSPLTAIYEFASILADGIAGECSPCQRGYLNIILRNADQLESMIDDLLEVTRAETGKLTIELQRASLRAIAAEAVETVGAAAAAKHLTLCIELEGESPPVYADPVRLRQVLLNLLNNAIKFTPDRGTVTVRTEMWQRRPGHVLASVSDTGCGIPPDALEHIFERLYQTGDDSVEGGRKGLGLGLYISRELIRRQAGEIWAESQVGRGSTFYFTLPVFSLAGVLSPILKPGERRQSLALICLSLTASMGWRSVEAKSAAVLAGVHLLRRCILPDLDLVLPQMESSDGVERIFIVALAAPSGVEVLVNRIRGQLERTREFKDPSFYWRISSESVQIPREFEELSDTEFCAAVADLISLRADTHGTERIANDQEENSYR